MIAEVERGERVLENHLQAAPQALPRGGIRIGDVAAAEQHASGGRPVKPKDRAAQGSFAAAALADQADGFMRPDVEANAIDSTGLGDGSSRDDVG